MHIVILLAVIMAIFGIIGYQRGIWPEVVSLVVLLAAFTLVEQSPQRLITYMNGLYIGLMLVIKSGLSDLSEGDMAAAAAKLKSIQRPFVDQRQGFALLVVMLVAAGIGYLLGRWIKSKKSPFGAALGILNGYILSAAFLPWLTTLPESALPVPLIREGEGLAVDASQKAGAAAAKLPWPVMLDWLTVKGGLPLIILMALLFVFAIWRMKTKKA